MHAAASSADTEALTRWNALMLAGRESRELWQEELQMGRALRRILQDQSMLPAWPLPQDAGYTACFAVAAVVAMLAAHAGNLYDGFSWTLDVPWAHRDDDGASERAQERS